MSIDEKIVHLKEKIAEQFNDISEFFDESEVIISLIKELTAEQIRINELIDEELYEQVIFINEKIDLYLRLMARWFAPMEFAGDYNFLMGIWEEVQQTNPHQGFSLSR